MAFTLPELPYPKDALAPHISAETLDFHHGKHHNTYVTNLNNLIEGTPMSGWSLEELVTRAGEAPEDKRKGVFNNAAQHFNHSFYWKSLRPAGGAGPGGDLAAAIDSTFGGLDAFKEQFTKTAVTHFGSGWAWLVKDSGGELAIVGTHDAGCPITDGATPLLTCDVWEHAYYIDYRNARPAYLENFWSLANWDFASGNFA